MDNQAMILLQLRVKVAELDQRIDQLKRVVVDWQQTPADQQAASVRESELRPIRQFLAGLIEQMQPNE